MIFALLIPVASWATILFEDNFDAQADFAPTGTINCISGSACTPTLPTGWTFYWIDEEWDAPTYNPAISITEANHRGASGKAYTQWNESNNGNSGDGWGADGVLDKVLATDAAEVYAGVWVKFQSGFQWGSADENMVKLFRIQHWDRDGEPNAFFTEGHTSPIVILDLKRGTYGWRNTTSFRCDPQATNYFCSWTEVIDQRWPPANSDFDDAGQIMDGEWHFIEFQVKMNTYAGSGSWNSDGIYRFWYDDVLIAEKTDAQFIEAGTDDTIGWNTIAIGGNSFNQWTAEVNHGEQWYAMDDFVVSTERITSDYVIGGTPPDTTAPVISNPGPSGVQSCTSNPRSVSLIATTDEAATGRYGAAGAAWDAMSAMSSTGGTSHSQSLTVACGESVSYGMRFRDAALNESYTSVSFSVAAESAPVEVSVKLTGGRCSGCQ